jgi:hypothetical protein
MKLQFLSAAAVFLICTGCMSVVVSEDGQPVGSRAGLLMVNPAAGSLDADIESMAEVSYEKVIDPKDSSLVTLGYGTYADDDTESEVLYILAGGRFYPVGMAPSGLFIHGDVGIGEYRYDPAGTDDYAFMWGVGTGYKFTIDWIVFEAGAGYMSTSFRESESEMLPVLRIQAGATF